MCRLLAGRRYKRTGPLAAAIEHGDPELAWERESALLDVERGVLTPETTYIAKAPEGVCRCCGHYRYWIRPDQSEYVCCWCVLPLTDPRIKFYEVAPKEYPCLARWRLLSETELSLLSESPDVASSPTRAGVDAVTREPVRSSRRS
jgi:hypothetical protein